MSRVHEGSWGDVDAVLVVGILTDQEALDAARQTWCLPAVYEPLTVHKCRLWRIRPVNRNEGKDYESEWLEWDDKPYGPGVFAARLVVAD